MCGVCIYWCGRRAGGGRNAVMWRNTVPVLVGTVPHSISIHNVACCAGPDHLAHTCTHPHTQSLLEALQPRSQRLCCVCGSVNHHAHCGGWSHHHAAPRGLLHRRLSLPFLNTRGDTAMRQVIPKRVRAWRASTTYISCDRCQQPQRDQVSILQASLGQAAHRVNGASPRGERSCRAR